MTGWLVYFQAPLYNGSYYPGCIALIDHGCWFRTSGDNRLEKEIVCTAADTTSFPGAKIYLSFEQGSNNDETWASTVDYSLNDQHYIPYFDSQCKVNASYDTNPSCNQIASNFSSFAFNGYSFQVHNSTYLSWDHNHARWNNISDCGGAYFTDYMPYSEAHCDGNIQARMNLTASWDGSGKNKIWYARQDTIIEDWKIHYSQTGDICTTCSACQTGYTLTYDTPGCPTNAAICTVYTPDCPDGFTPSILPPRCNVDSNISYTDETGIFTLANGFYEADTTGYTSNTTCDLQN